MACVYFYKGKLIGNEIQLNDFLIERRQFHSKYGDIVYQRSQRLNQSIKTVDDKIIPDSAKWKSKMDEMWRLGGQLYDDDGEKLVIYDILYTEFVCFSYITKVYIKIWHTYTFGI